MLTIQHGRRLSHPLARAAIAPANISHNLVNE